MKRTLEFYNEENEYTLKENCESIFKISKEDLIFDSKLFYECIFKNFDDYFNFELKCDDDIDGQGEYILIWLKKLVTRVSEALNKELKLQPNNNESIGEINLEIQQNNNEDSGEINLEVEPNTNENDGENNLEVHAKVGKEIKLFDLRVCAGDGNYLFDEDNYTLISTENENADFAVELSGDSMSPEYPDKSIILIKQAADLNDGEIGIFTVDNQLMCKKYKKTARTTTLEPINKKFESIKINRNIEFKIHGKVIGIN